MEAHDRKRVGLFESERPEKHAVEYAENGSVGADSERERHRRHEREPRLFAQEPQRDDRVVFPRGHS